MLDLTRLSASRFFGSIQTVYKRFQGALRVDRLAEEHDKLQAGDAGSDFCSGLPDLQDPKTSQLHKLALLYYAMTNTYDALTPAGNGGNTTAHTELGIIWAKFGPYAQTTVSEASSSPARGEEGSFLTYPDINAALTAIPASTSEPIQAGYFNRTILHSLVGLLKEVQVWLGKHGTDTTASTFSAQQYRAIWALRRAFYLAVGNLTDNEKYDRSTFWSSLARKGRLELVVGGEEALQALRLSSDNIKELDLALQGLSQWRLDEAKRQYERYEETKAAPPPVPPRSTSSATAPEAPASAAAAVPAASTSTAASPVPAPTAPPLPPQRSPATSVARGGRTLQFTHDAKQGDSGQDPLEGMPPSPEAAKTAKAKQGVTLLSSAPTVSAPTVNNQQKEADASASTPKAKRLRRALYGVLASVLVAGAASVAIYSISAGPLGPWSWAAVINTQGLMALNFFSLAAVTALVYSATALMIAALRPRPGAQKDWQLHLIAVAAGAFVCMGTSALVFAPVPAIAVLLVAACLAVASASITISVVRRLNPVELAPASAGTISSPTSKQRPKRAAEVKPVSGPATSPGSVVKERASSHDSAVPLSETSTAAAGSPPRCISHSIHW